MINVNQMLFIKPGDIDRINRFFSNPDNLMAKELSELIEKFGGVDHINQKSKAARNIITLMQRLKEIDSPYLADLEWLIEQRDKKAFISMDDYCREHTGKEISAIDFSNAVTLEISAMQFFPWLMAEAKQCIENRELMPGRIIRVRNMKEQADDQGDLLAVTCAMQIIGATWVESLDTRGTDGGNIHLGGGPDTLAGFFTGIGQPNDYPVKWAEEYLYYATNYGVKQVLNINPGTILMGYMMHRLGIDIEFKISVFVGNDNPYFILWTLMTARMFSRQDGSTSLVGFNLSNAVNNDTIIQADMIRNAMGLEKAVRFEHHITEPQKGIVAQPYCRRDELVELARKVPNISAKHEGGEPEVDANRERPSDIFDYFISKEEILKQGLMEKMERNYLDKHDSVNLTARTLLKAGIGVVAAQNLH